MSDAQNRTTQRAPAWPKWRDPFLTALEQHGVVSRACEAANVPRRTAYDRRAADPEFAAAWEAAEYAGSESLIAEAYRRAVDGVERIVHSGGKEIGVEREYSDTLLALLLKAKRPDQFKDRVENRNYNIAVEDVGKLPDEELKRIVEGK